jgi:hypothetical protein
MKSTLALALALGLSTSVLAAPNPGAGFQQKGTPEAKAGTLSTYGIEVPVRTALKSLVPTGWRLFVHKSATLPSAVSWKPGDTWTDVLSKAALHADLAALVDWDARTVLIRTREVALQESAVRTEIAQAASTPLPRFDAPQGLSLESAADVPAVPASPLTVPVADGPPKQEPVTYAFSTAPAVPLDSAVTALPAENTPAAVDVPPPQAPLPLVGALAPEIEPVAAVAAKTTDPLLALIQLTALASSGDANVAALASEVSAAGQAPTAPLLAEQTWAMPPGAPQDGTVGDPEAAPVPASADAAPVMVSATASAAPLEERVPTPLAAAVAHALNEQGVTTGAKPRYTVDAGGNIVTTDAFTALAAAATLGEPTVVPVDPSPAAAATLKALFTAPVEQRATLAQDMPKTALVPAAPPQALVQHTAAPALRAQPLEPVLAKAAASPSPKALRDETRGDFEQARTVETSPPLLLVTQAPAPVVLPAVPVFRVNPTPEMVREQVAALGAKPVRLVSTRDFTYTAPVALNRAPAKAVAQAIANRFDLRLVWVAPDLRMPGPVTLLSNSVDQDIALFQKAMGLYAPVTLELSMTGDLRVISRDTAYVKAHTAAAAKASLSLALAQSTEYQMVSADETEVMRGPGPAGDMPAPVAPVAPVLHLVVEQGDSLESAVKRFVQAQGYTHEWKVSGGFDANRKLAFEANTLAEVLSQVLPGLGVSADIYTTDKHIVIRPGDYRE